MRPRAPAAAMASLALTLSLALLQPACPRPETSSTSSSTSQRTSPSASSPTTATPSTVIATQLEAEARLDLLFRRDFLPSVRRETPIRIVIDLVQQPDLLAIARLADAHAPALSRADRKRFVAGALKPGVAAQQALASELLARPEVRDVVEFDSLARIAFTGPARMAKELAARDDVAWGWGRALQPPAPRPVPDDRPPGSGTPWAAAAMRAPEAWALGHAGRGVHVCVLDSASPIEPAPLAGRRAVIARPPAGASLPDEGRGHGLAVAGAAVGASGLGIAPEATWSVANPLGGGVLDPEAFAAVIDWLLHDAQPDVVVMPWDVPADSVPDYQLAVPIGALRTAGMAVVFPSGNTGPVSGANQPPANLVGLAPDGAPAFSVGGVNPDLSPYEASNRGPNAHDGSTFPQVAAPASDVSVIDPVTGGVRAGHGTSFSSGFAAGALAIVLGAHPERTGPQAEKLLRETARDLGAPGPDDTFGHGLIDLAKASVTGAGR